MTTTATTATVSLDVHICDQRRSYKATFTSEAQALAFIQPRRSTHAINPWSDADAELIADTWPALADLLWPTCEHGLSAGLCAGPGHYPADM